jgi:hypothetical protein
MTRSPARWLLLALLLVCVLVCAGCRGPKGKWRLPGTTPPSRAAVVPTCPLDGLPTTAVALARRPLAVMVENSPQARPQSGLDHACVVYEAVTEGGITRFMAVYLHDDASAIGPVRSVRPHFINLEQEYDAALVHCGESYEALQILYDNPAIYNLDQLKYSKPFWRSRDRRMPHNLYTATDRLRAFLVKQGWEGPAVSLPTFVSSAQPLATGDETAQADVTFGGGIRYRLQLVYDPARRGFVRYQDRRLHVDRVTGQPLVARNVIIQEVEETAFATSKLGTQDVRVIGSGRGWFLGNGRRLPLQWSKSTASSPTLFTDEGGSPLPFQPGQTWIELISRSHGKIMFHAPLPPKSP